MIEDVTDPGDPERAEALQDQAYDDALSERLEELERHTAKKGRGQVWFLGFAGLTLSLLATGVGSAANTLATNKDTFTDLPWGALLGTAPAVAALVVGLARLWLPVARLREDVRSKGEQDRQVAVSATGMNQLVRLHNHVVRQQSALHYSMRRRGDW